MDMGELVESVRALDGVLVLAPAPGSDAPEIAWGDTFFYYAPDGVTPTNTQPFATIVTKDYPGDTLSQLDPPGRWRVNVHVGRDRLRELAAAESPDFAAVDVVLPHPVYARMGWISVVSPGERTSGIVEELLAGAHADARRRYERTRDVNPEE